jgi:hypothetical protein
MLFPHFRAAVSLIAALMAGCSPPAAEVKSNPPAQVVQPAKDYSSKLVEENLVRSGVTAGRVADLPFLPKGTFGEYQRGKLSWKVYLIDTASPNEAANLLFDWKKTMTDPKVVAHMGGYFGLARQEKTFLFAKNRWLVALVGLDEELADQEGRKVALRL